MLVSLCARVLHRRYSNKRRDRNFAAMDVIVYILASVTVVSLLALVGVFFVFFKESHLRKILTGLVGFASGTLLGGAFLHLLPEAVAEAGEASAAFYYVVVGIVLFFVLEKFLYWRHCHDQECPVHMFAYLNLIGDGIHNFVDGMIIAATFMFSVDLGVTTTLAVMFHEIPQEIGDFGVLIYGGMSKRRALAYNSLSAVTAFLGAVTAYFVEYLQTAEGFLIPFAAGSFIYIAATDLMPEMHKRHQLHETVLQLVVILLGIGLMAFLKGFLGG